MQKPNFKEAQKRENKLINIIYDKYKIPNEIINYGKNKLYFIKTYGCQMNEHDSEVISAMLEDIGYKKTNDYELADIIILNTCAIRENVHNKVFGMLGRIKHLKETRKDNIVGICGCMSQEETVVEKIMAKYKHLDFVFGTHNIFDFPNILNNVVKNKNQIIEVLSNSDDVIENLPFKRDSKYKAWVNIMYGCDNFCTYCIVPYTRGRQKSRLKEDILKEVKDLIKQGYQEITLLGQNVNSYGKDFKDQSYNFANLLEDVAKTNIPRICFVTSNPNDFTLEMIKVIKNNKNVLPYIHLPIQAGSNKILKLMGRKYTKEEYIQLANTIKKEIPNVVLSTDIIVGFPNETKEDFEDTIDVVNQIKFDFAYTFIYSKRDGTPAAKMPDDVTKEEKEQRLYKLNDLINWYANESNQRQVGRTLSILVEGISEKNKDKVVGHAENYKLVNIKADKNTIGKIINVKITGAKSWSLDGEIIE